MGIWNEHEIRVIEKEDTILLCLGAKFGASEDISVLRHDGKVAIRLTFDEDHDGEDDFTEIGNALLAASRKGAKALWHRFSANDGGFTGILEFDGYESCKSILRIDRLIRDTDLALLYARVENGEESPEELGEAFTDMIPDPEEPEEVEEAFAVLEMLMKHRVVPADDDIEYWQEAHEALRTALGLEDEDELEDWKRETLHWLESVCQQTEAA